MTTRSTADFERGLPDDGHYLPTIKQHSLEKIRRHNCYARIFATAMKNRWPQLAYIGLYSGAGRARVEETQEIVETTALSVFRMPDPFTDYIFVDRDPQCIAALGNRTAALANRFRVSILEGDVNDLSDEIRRAMPRFSKTRGLLSFCFVDPCDANLKFNTIRMLGAAYRMDFLVLLAVGMDVRRNLRHYYEDRSDSRIAELIDCPGWRDEYDARTGEGIVRFILRKFDEAMLGLGYRSARPGHRHPVNAHGTGVMQYVLVLYSKDPLGQKIWESTLASSDPQLGLGLSE